MGSEHHSETLCHCSSVPDLRWDSALSRSAGGCLRGNNCKTQAGVKNCGKCLSSFYVWIFSSPVWSAYTYVGVHKLKTLRNQLMVLHPQAQALTSQEASSTAHVHYLMTGYWPCWHTALISEFSLIEFTVHTQCSAVVLKGAQASFEHASVGLEVGQLPESIALPRHCSVLIYFFVLWL